jgi:NADH dehydrogenase
VNVDPKGCGSVAVKEADVVVVGAGFGGLNLIESLAGEDLDLLLVDRHNYHTFQPLLYQVATAGLGPEHVAHSVRDILQSQSNASFRMGTVQDVHFEDRTIQLESSDALRYKYLVIAAGASSNYFGIEGAREHSVPIKNLHNAMFLRTHILERFEEADRNPDRIDDGILNFVVVGGGPTGIETAGALMELFDQVFRYDYSDELVDRARVVLVEMLPHLLDPYEESLRSYTREALEKRGVEVMVETTVEHVSDQAVQLKDKPALPTETLIWAAGVKANPLADHLDVDQTRGGRIQVDGDLRVPARDSTFAIGDIAGARDPEGTLLPQLAPVAIQQGQHVARQIKRLEKGDVTETFEYDDPGQMATIGRHDAVVELNNGWRLSGYFAWLIWVFLHIAKLIGFRNKLMVFMSWVYNYFTYGSSSRLILDVERENDLIHPESSETSNESGNRGSQA